LTKIKIENEGNLKVIDALKYENEITKKEKQSLLDSMEEKNKRFTEELGSVRNQLSQ
jgi:hypothetical protein